MQRIKLERKHGMRSADVVLMPHYAVSTMGREGELGDHASPSANDALTNTRVSPDGAVPVGVSFMAMAYNTKVLGTKSLPSDLSDFGESWKGRLGSQSLTASRAGNLGAWYLSFLRSETEKEVWIEFVSSLGKENRPLTYDCIDHLLQGLINREVGLALTVYSLAYFREKTAGSPVALVEASRIPHMMTFTSAGLVKESEDSRPARKFMGFLLTPQAQDIIGSIPGIAPVLRKTKASYDFEHEYDERTQFHPKEKDFSQIESDLALFRKLGLP
jgi:ABC-type thiamine transport system substrate-binding protein